MATSTPPPPPTKTPHPPSPPHPPTQQPPQPPPRIQQLSKKVIDLIAAGEVIQRPVSVAKELIENSLDAHSTSIDISCTGGGLHRLSIVDDGIGMHPEDMALAATRFATSKLVSFDDLRSIRTFGFRGEALASASMVGRLSIVSRRRKRRKTTNSNNTTASSSALLSSKYSSACAYRQTYLDGKPTNLKPSPSAGKEGTTVKLEDLFYNLPSRRRSFEGTGSARKLNDEYDRILNVAQRYAVHRARGGVGFVCRKQGGSGGKSSDLNTMGIGSVKRLRQRGLDADDIDIDDGDSGNDEDDGQLQKMRLDATKDVIQHVFGSNVARELLVLRAGEGDVVKVSIAALKELQKEDMEGEASQTMGSGANNKTVSSQSATTTGTGEEFTYRGSLLTDNSISMGTSNDFGAELATKSNNNNNNNNNTESSTNMDIDDDHSSLQYTFAYKAYGLLTNGSYSPPKSSSAFILFLNGRLVQSNPIRRAVEGVYADTLPTTTPGTTGTAKPFIYLSLELPGPHVDVNVHPTKREVALLHEDRLCDALAGVVRDLLGGAATSRRFYAQALLPVVKKQTGKANGGTQQEMVGGISNNDDDEDEDFVEDGKKSTSQTTSPSKRRRPTTTTAGSETMSPPSSARKKPYDPKNLVRTTNAAHQGALEPFLVSTQTQSPEKTSTTATNNNCNPYQHAPDCELASTNKNKIDLSKPGAFASIICRCQIAHAETLPPSQQRQLPLTTSSTYTRPKKIIPTECTLSTIQALRTDITERAHTETTTKLRDSVFVGCISRRRSLLQSGIELLMVNHYELARELFYQIAVLRFGGFQCARLGDDGGTGGGGLMVKVLLEQALQFEEKISSSASSSAPFGTIGVAHVGITSVSKTNSKLADQASRCLADNADMLNEYFSIRLETKNDDHKEGEDEKKVLMLTGLPILLDGHSPSPHALPLFLLRLATEVDWSEERPCFEGICTELGSYYAEIPPATACDGEDKDNDFVEKGTNGRKEVTEESKNLIDQGSKMFVQHTLFPALKFILIPPKEFASDGSFCKLALLSKLYKVFERC